MSDKYDIKPPKAEEDQKPTHAITAFLVFIDAEGNPVATNDLGMDLDVERSAHPHEIARACREVVHDISVMQTSESVIRGMMATTQKIAEQQQNQKIAQKLQSKGDHLSPKKQKR